MSYNTLHEDSLQTAQDRYLLLFNNANDLIQCVRNDGTFVYVNPAWLKTLEYTPNELPHLTYLDIIHPEERNHCMAAFAQLMAGEFQGKVETRFISKTGKTIWVEGNLSLTRKDGQVVSTVGLFRDITDRKRMEAENAALQARLLETSKLAAIGQLVNGIAHNFNNIMTFVKGSLELIRRHDHPDITPHLDRMEKGCEQALSLIDKLMAFSTEQCHTASFPIDINSYLAGLTALRELITTHNVSLQLKLDTSLPPVLIRPSDLEQLILNMAQNACEAMEDMPDKQLVIQTEYMTVSNVMDQAVSGEQPCLCLAPGPYMKLTVQDTGKGIDKNIIQHIFEPFFTTKPMGQATGLGLAMVYGIVYGNKGFIDVKSQPGKGSTFTIYWPVKPT
ncbi:MAG: PAS domain S-box protein [Dissulfuribacterales bacterium]